MLARLALSGRAAAVAARAAPARVHAAVPLCRARVPAGARPARMALSEVATAEKPPVSRALGWWLAGCAGVVGGIVVVGGLTRLTRSGLSMVDWKPQGGAPPSTSEEWTAEFDKYKEFPEWQQRQDMTLDEFKRIYYYEYTHRMLGRSVGVLFGVPLAAFWATGRVPAHLRKRLLTLLGLGAAQGGIGWWMVKSGLDEDLVRKDREIRVSPYRLATHLAMAFTTYSLLLWTAMDILAPASAIKARGVPVDVLQKLKGVRGLSLITAKLVALTVVSGAFVAGNDAGRAYNEFPKMLPDQIWEVEPSWRNVFESTALVQLDHRLLALTTTSSVAALLAAARGHTGVWQALPAQSKAAVSAVLLATGTQVGLGISTLLAYVPVELGVAHQAGALALLSSCLWAAHSMRFVKQLAPRMSSSSAAVKAKAAAEAAPKIKVKHVTS